MGWCPGEVTKGPGEAGALTSTLLHQTVCGKGQDRHGAMRRVTAQHQLLTSCPGLSKAPSAAPLLKNVNLGAGKSTSQLHSEKMLLVLAGL